LQAVRAAREAKMEVVGVLALFSYGFPEAADAFAKENCTLITLSNYSVLLREATKLNYITEEEAGVLQNWSNNPQKWSDTFTKNSQN
jgi:orotate phosphoribosyltransferase